MQKIQMTNKIRCDWCGTDPIYMDYHDNEWGKPIYDSRALWEKLILDGFQAGLSWITILKRREGFIKAFNEFNPAIVACYGDKEIKRLLSDKGIIRNRIKILSTIKNAKLYLEIEVKKHGNFSEFIWSFTDGKIQKNKFYSIEEVPTQSQESEAMSKALKKYGFGFCGPTICYAFMEAVGIINNHLVSCHKYKK